MNALELLEQLYDMKCKADLLHSDKEQARKAAMPVEVVAELAAIDAEYEPMEAEVNAKIADLEAAVKSTVAALGETVKVRGLQAVYTAGRVTWDAKALDGYLLHEPALAAFRKVGEPSVSIRAAK